MNRRSAFERREIPLWRQAAEGISLVLLLALMVGATGLAISLVIALVF